MQTPLPLPQQEQSSDDRPLRVLTADERYHVWLVKAAERPQWLQTYKETSEDVNIGKSTQNACSKANRREEKKDELTDDRSFCVVSDAAVVDADEHYEGSSDVCLPLTDGCDIPAWRQRRLALSKSLSESPSGSYWENVEATIGWGSPLLRRNDDLFLQLPNFCSASLSRWEALRQLLLSSSPCKNVERIHLSDYPDHPLPWEMENRPVLIEKLDDDSFSSPLLTWNGLVTQYGHVEWRFSDTHGETLPLETYDTYCRHQADDAPLAVYDSQFHIRSDDKEDSRPDTLVSSYRIPSCFPSTDLFAQHLPPNRRPPDRWILMGPERSGTGWHVDPVGTHAWVTLTEGCKRWILVPPNPSKDIEELLWGKWGEEKKEWPSAWWFADFFAQEEHQSGEPFNCPLITKCLVDAGAVEILQSPGETVYVPAGWWHAVLNLDQAVAVTHNYASVYPSLDKLRAALQREEPELLTLFEKSYSKVQ